MIRVGIIGAGGIARTHAEHLGQRTDCRVTAVVDPRLDVATELAARHGAQAFSELEPALELIDAAYVLTPPRARLSTIAALAARGIPIFCEKPLAATTADARAIAELVTSSPAPFMMGFMRRWHPAYAPIAAAVRAGELGDLTQLSRTRMGRLALADDNWRVTAGQQVGVTIESVSHDLDLLAWLGGRISSAQGAVLASDPARPDFDDTMVATLRFDSGAIGSLQVSWASDIGLNDLLVLGTRGARAIRGRGMWTSTEFGVGATGETAWHPVDPANGQDDGYRGENDAFLRLVAGEAVDHPGIDDGVRTVELSHELLATAGGIRAPLAG